MPMGIDPFRNISKENKATIQKFQSDMALQDLSQYTINTYRTLLANLARYLKTTTFENVTTEQMQEFFRTSKLSRGSQETAKITIKRFYRWLYKLEKDDKLPDSVRWIKFLTDKQKRRLQDPNADTKSIITEAEYQALLKHAPTLQDKAISEATKRRLDIIRKQNEKLPENKKKHIGRPAGRKDSKKRSSFGYQMRWYKQRGGKFETDVTPERIDLSEK
jgi:hypothetical protein